MKPPTYSGMMLMMFFPKNENPSMVINAAIKRPLIFILKCFNKNILIKPIMAAFIKAAPTPPSSKKSVTKMVGDLAISPRCYVL